MHRSPWITITVCNIDLGEIVFLVLVLQNEELWRPVMSYKREGFASVIPGNASTYIFDDEDAYLKS